MNERFAQTCADYLHSAQVENGFAIGELGEKPLHAILKNYLEPNPLLHELRVGRYVADILRGDEIVEIQTGNYHGFAKKLEKLLQSHRVTVVLPLAQVKYLLWVNPTTGEVAPGRRSPKAQRLPDAFYELFWIAPLLAHPRLQVQVLFLELEEYRLQNGWGKGGKRGSRRVTRVPRQLLGEVVLHTLEDYQEALPQGLPAPFTRKELEKAGKISPTLSQRLLLALEKRGCIYRAGKAKNAILWEKIEKTER